MDNKSGKILVCDVCGSHTDHVVCFNNDKENEVRVCKDCMERAMGTFEDEKPKRKPEERKPEDGHANKHRDQMIKDLRDDLKKKMDLVSTDKAYNNRVEEYIRLSKDNTELTGRVKKLVIENTYMKESLGKLSNGLVKVMIIVALLGVGVGVITTALLMR